MDQEAEVMQIWKKDGQEQKWEESPVILLQKANMSFRWPLSLHLQMDHLLGLQWLMENYKSKGIMSTCGHTNHIYNTHHKNILSVEKGHYLGTNPRL